MIRSHRLMGAVGPAVLIIAGVALPTDAAEHDITAFLTGGGAAMSEYYGGPVTFSNGASHTLAVDPGSGGLVGAECDWAFDKDMYFTVSGRYMRGDVVFSEDGTVGVSPSITTWGGDIGIIYRALGEEASSGLLVGGGLTVDVVSLQDVVWNAQTISPLLTLPGAYLTAGPEFPVSKQVALRLQARLAVRAVGLGQLEEALGPAQGAGVSAILNKGGSSSSFGITASIGVAISGGQ